MSKLNAEVHEKSNEKLRLETTARELHEALAELKVAGREAEETVKQSSGLRDQARVLTDKYNLITTRIRDVVQAMDHLHGDLSAEYWDIACFTALQALKGMLGGSLGQLGDDQLLNWEGNILYEDPVELVRGSCD